MMTLQSQHPVRLSDWGSCARTPRMLLDPAQDIHPFPGRSRVPPAPRSRHTWSLQTYPFVLPLGMKRSTHSQNKQQEPSSSIVMREEIRQ